MYAKLIIDGDAVYETDEECLRRKKEGEETKEKGKRGETNKTS